MRRNEMATARGPSVATRALLTPAPPKSRPRSSTSRTASARQRWLRVGGGGAVVTISTAQNGGKVAVRAGDSITLRLPENPATGYRWTFSSLGVEGDRRANRFEGGGAGVGGGGQAVWTLRARAAGST